MEERARQLRFTEDGCEFNQIGSNLAMICATIAPGSTPVRRLPRANPQQRIDRAGMRSTPQKHATARKSRKNRAGEVLLTVLAITGMKLVSPFQRGTM